MMVSNSARFGTERALEPLKRDNRAGQHLLGLFRTYIESILMTKKLVQVERRPATSALFGAPLRDKVTSSAQSLAPFRSGPSQGVRPSILN
jgi:hypothetical protein